MPAERRRLPPAITAIPRDVVEAVHHKDIDNRLKDLRACSRRLKVAMDSFADELRILERLYYKSKNQHRMALPFKRVVEIRRYSRRVEELDILECIDLLRASFVGLEGTTDRKALKSSWSHVPQPGYVTYVIERLSSCSTLVCKMRERLGAAYHHFSLAMQSGAFIQLIILFAAICSRLTALSSEIDAALELSASTCTRLLLILDPTNKLTSTAVHSMQEPAAGLDGSRTSEIYLVKPTEDVGQPISRFDHTDTPRSVLVPIPDEKTASRTHITPPPCYSNTIAVNLTTAQASEQASAKVVQKPRLKHGKKTRKRDDIDEIFGF